MDNGQSIILYSFDFIHFVSGEQRIKNIIHCCSVLVIVWHKIQDSSYMDTFVMQ